MGKLFNFKNTKEEYKLFDEMIADTEKYGISFGTRAYNEFIEDTKKNFRRYIDPTFFTDRIYSVTYSNGHGFNKEMTKAKRTSRGTFFRKIINNKKARTLFACSTVDINGFERTVSAPRVCSIEFKGESEPRRYPFTVKDNEHLGLAAFYLSNKKLFEYIAAECMDEDSLCGCWPIADAVFFDPFEPAACMTFLYFAEKREAAYWLWAYMQVRKNVLKKAENDILLPFICAYLLGVNLLEEIEINEDVRGYFNIFRLKGLDFNAIYKAFLAEKYGINENNERCGRSRDMDYLRNEYMPKLMDIVGLLKMNGKASAEEFRAELFRLLEKYGIDATVNMK